MAAGDVSLNIIIGASLGGSFGATMGAATSAIQQLASGNVMGALGTAAIAAGAAVVGIGASAVTAAGTFQQSMTQLVTSAGEAQSNIKAVGDGVKQVSVDTGTSTQQLASAMYYIESSGQHGAAGLTELGAAARGAKSENADLATVAKALTTVMTDYHLPVSDSTAAMNGLIATVQNGKTNLQDLSASMGQVLPVASSMGISFPQVAGAIATLTNAGVPAQQAAQNLAHVLVALQAPSKVAQTSMKDVGLSAQQVKDALVSQGLPAALQLIEDHVGKKFPAGSVQAETALKNIMGGLVGLKLASALTGDSLTTTEGNIKKVATAFDAAGAAVMGWDEVQQGFNFQMDRAKAALDVFMITLGQKLLPILTPIVKGFADFVTGITNFVSGLSNAASSGDTFVKFLTSLGVNAQTARDIFNDLHTAFGLIGDIASRVGDILHTVFGGALQIVGTLIVGFINGPLNDILQGFNDVLQGVDDFAKSIQDDFTNLSDNANTWGQNLGISFENGLISVAADIIAVAEQIAQGIADYLGFQSPTRKGPGSTLAKWGIGMVSGLAQSIIAAGPLITNAVLSVASQLQTASTSGGILHTAVASMIDPLSGDEMTATVTPDAAISHPKTGLDTTALKSATASRSTATTTTTTVATAVKASATAVVSAVASGASKVASTVSSAVTSAASKASAQKSSTSAAAAQQRASHAAASAKARQQAATQRAPHTAAMQKAHQLAHQQRQAAAAQRAQQHKEAQAKREQIHQALLAQRAAEKTAKAAEKAGPPAVAGATPNMDIPSLSKSLDGIKKKITDAFAPLKDAAANAKLLQQNISNSFTGIQAKAQELQANLKQFFDWLNRTFAPVWSQISDTWNNHIIPDLAKIKKSFDDASPSLKDIVKILGQLLGLGLLVFFENLAGALYAADYVVERLSDAVTLMVQQWLWVVQQLKPVFDWIVQGLQWVYDQIIGHSIIPDLINGIMTWFNKLIDFFPNIMSKIKNTLVQWWNQIKTDVSNFWKSVQSIFSSAWTAYIQKPLQTLMTNLISWWNTLKTSVTTWTKNVWAAISAIFQLAWSTYIQKPLQTMSTSFQQWFTQLGTNMTTWGGNLMKMFAQGITNGITGVQQAAINVAQTVKNYLGIQSPAAMGPLSSAHTWMPNLMNMMAGQIKAGSSATTSAATSMANGIQQPIAAMASNVKQSIQAMNAEIATVGGNLTNMQSQVHAGIQTLQADMASAMASIRGNLVAEKSLITQTIQYLAQQMNAMGQVIAATVATANQGTAKVGQDAQIVTQAGKAIQVNLDLSNQATKKAFDDQLTAISSAKSAMEAMGMSKDAESKALSSAVQASNNAYLSALSQGKSQADALKAGTNAFNASIKASESASSAQTSTASAQTASSSAQSSGVSASSSLNSAQLSEASQVLSSMAEGQSGIAAMIAEQSAQQSLQASGLSDIQRALAEDKAALAYDAALKAALAHGKSSTEANQAAVNAFNASIKASESSASANKSKSSSSASTNSAKDAASAANQSATAAKTSSQGDAKAQTYSADASSQAGIISGLLKSAGGMLSGLKADAAQASGLAASISAMAASAAASMASMLAIHSPAKEGPLSDADKWMPNLMQMFMTALNAEAPKLKDASSITAKGVKDAFDEAAIAVGATITSLKQKKDDIYATLSAYSSSTGGTAGTPGTAGTYALTTANVAGDIPVQYQLTPPTPGTAGTSGTQTTQNMTVHIDLDGKTLGKYVGTYLNKELHVQGGVRGR